MLPFSLSLTRNYDVNLNLNGSSFRSSHSLSEDLNPVFRPCVLSSRVLPLVDFYYYTTSLW